MEEGLEWVESDTFGLAQQTTKEKHVRNVSKKYPNNKVG